VCDISSGLQECKITDVIEKNSIDVVLLIFVLSALSPSKMQSVFKTLHHLLKPGGVILFRDYAMYDMTQVRFLSKNNRKLADNYYVRADGTSTYYFTKEDLNSLAQSVGFKNDILKYDTRELINRKRCLKMYRVWLTARFIKSETIIEGTI